MKSFGTLARSFLRWGSLAALAVAFVLTLAPVRARADWWSDNFQVHGYLRSRAYLRSRSLDLAREAKISSWRTELDIEPSLRIYQGDNLRLSFFGIFRPTYDAVYNLNPHIWGEDARGGSYGTAPFDFAYLTDPNGMTATPTPGPLGSSFISQYLTGSTGPNQYQGQNVVNGQPFPGHGAGVAGEFYLGNADTLSLFRATPGPALTASSLETGGVLNTQAIANAIAAATRYTAVPAIGIDNNAEFGAEMAPVLPRGSRQPEIGGPISAATFIPYLHSNTRVLFGFDQVRQAFLRQLTAANSTAATSFAANVVDGATAALRNTLTKSAVHGLGTPFTPYGDASSLKQSPFDINRTQAQLAWDCNDNAHPGCFVREAYFDITYKNLFVRIGKQQIVWGKADGFQLQDIVNPRDLGQHNIFPLTADEDRRIPQLALDAQYDFGDVGPLEDVSLELVWNFDKFIPNQFGQCGEPYAFEIACVARDQAALHQVLGIGLAGSEKIPWKFTNTEPGLRLQFRIPRPSIGASLSAYWGFQDNPVQKLVNRYSVSNPNVAAMMLLQGQIGPLLNFLNSSATDPNVTQGTALYASSGFDAYNPSDVSRVSQAIAAAYTTLVKTGNSLTPVTCASLGATQGAALGRCLDQSEARLLALPFTGGEFELVYPRVLTLGGSADYEIPDSGTIMRTEFAYDFNEGIQDTSAYPTLMRKADVLKFMVGFDRPTFIRFLNPNRTAFLTFQTFLQHIVQYGNHGYGTGTVLPETQILSTFLMQNYWRSDSIILTNFVVYDWNARAWATGPSLTWHYNNNISFNIGINVLFGSQNHVHNIIDMCPGGTLSFSGTCNAADPATWTPGEFQTVNRNISRFGNTPFQNLQSFADLFQEDRDEYWAGVTYQF